MLRAEALLREHDINVVRSDLGENPATAIWLWGHGPLPVLPSFHERYGVRGGLVADSEVVRGIGRLIGWGVLDAPEGNDPAAHDYSATGRTAVAAIDLFDLVCVHLDAPYTFGTLGNFTGKVSALEAIDREVVAPLLERLERETEWRMLVIPARTSSAQGQPELASQTVFVLGGNDIDSNRGEAFDEENAASGELHPDRASDLMEYFLRR
jgi:2,3-bisphosphoglycerate-independent phosphoglycerate mutase